MTSERNKEPPRRSFKLDKKATRNLKSLVPQESDLPNKS